MRVVRGDSSRDFKQRGKADEPTETTYLFVGNSNCTTNTYQPTQLSLNSDTRIDIGGEVVVGVQCTCDRTKTVGSPVAVFKEDTAKSLCTVLAADGTDEEVGKDVDSKSSDGKLDSRGPGVHLLEADFVLYLVMQHLAESAILDFVRLGVISKSCQAAYQSLLAQDINIKNAVTCNQKLYGIIQVALERESAARQRPRSRITDRWLNHDDHLSGFKILFRWPELFPYFPPIVCFCMSVLLFVFSLLKYSELEKTLNKVMLGELMAYALVVNSVASYCFMAKVLSINVFLWGLAILFNLFMLVHCLVALTGFVLFFLGFQTLFLGLAVGFSFSTWTIYKHAENDFRPGSRKRNTIASLGYSASFVAFYLVFASDT